MTRSGVEGRDDDMLLGMKKPGRLRLSEKKVDASKLSQRVGGVRLAGKEVDASKLDEMVREDVNSESTLQSMRKRTTGKRTGMRIWKAVTTLRRFCSIQFFQSNSPNCAVFDIVMLSTTRCCKLQQTQPVPILRFKVRSTEHGERAEREPITGAWGRSP